MGGEKAVGVGRDHEIGISSDDGVGEIKADAFGESPSGQIDGIATAVVEFDVFAVEMIGGGIKHDFIDDDVLVAIGGIVGGVLGMTGPAIEFSTADGEKLEAFFVEIAVQLDGVDDSAVLNEEEIDISIFISGKIGREAEVSSSGNASGKINRVSE